ncbi:putative bifunctional diguanylate cyclase/phosphodiesterase [Sphingorhabdus lutea]|nr:EAL domain-containing protein [Sphingorhabdus lutea]
MRGHSASLMREQFAAIKKQIPILYSLLVINSLFLAIVISESVSPIFAFGFPLLLCVGALIRMIYWRRDIAPTAKLRAKQVQQKLYIVNIVALLFTLLLGYWAITGMVLMNPQDRYYAGFFAILSCITCTYCLLSMPSAAYIVILFGAVPISVSLAIVGDGNLALGGLNLTIIGLLVTKMVQAQWEQLKTMVRSNMLIGFEKARAHRLANQDALTLLPNRRAFVGWLDALTPRQKENGVGLLLIDLNGFKMVNDTYGHDVGDEVLKISMQRFEKCLGEGQHLARLGGDEFAILVYNATQSKISALARLIITSLTKQIEINGVFHNVGAGIGSSFSVKRDVKFEQMLKRADIALYSAKKSRQSKYRPFIQSMEEALKRRSAIENALTNETEFAKIQLLFQPILSSNSHHIVGLEALARWKIPHIGDVSPREFLQVAQDMGLMDKLSEHLFIKLLESMDFWPQNIWISFNMSAREIMSKRSLQKLVKLADSRDFDLTRLKIELKETSLVTDLDAMIKILNILQSRGVGVILDDFGSGLAAISVLQKMKIEMVKIDHHLLHEARNCPRALDLYHGLLMLLRSINMPVVATGVESEDHKMILRALPVDYLQGFYIGRPFNVGDAAEFFDPAKLLQLQ